MSQLCLPPLWRCKLTSRQLAAWRLLSALAAQPLAWQQKLAMVCFMWHLERRTNCGNTNEPCMQQLQQPMRLASILTPPR